MASKRDVILVVKDPRIKRNRYDVVIDWIQRNAPQLADAFEVQILPVTLDPSWNAPSAP